MLPLAWMQHLSVSMSTEDVQRCRLCRTQEEMAGKLRALQQQCRADVDAENARSAEATRNMHDAKAAAQRTETQLRCGC